MSDAPSEPPDETHVGVVMFYPETLRFIFKSLCFYRDLLKENAKALELDAELKNLVAGQPGQVSTFDRELQRVSRIVEWHEERRKQGEWDYDLGSLSWGSIRFYKSVCILYLKHLRQKRNDFSRRSNLSKHVLEDVDAKIALFEEKLTIGVFASVTPRPLLIDEIVASQEKSDQQDVSSQPSPSLGRVEPAKPVFLESIQILDPVLRERCLDLFAEFQAPDKQNRLDTVIVEASRILEDRMRSILGETGGVTGDRLAVIAFGKDNPKLIVSTIAAEQEAAMLLFKGLFGHIRNPSHHKLLGQLSPDRTLQIVGMLDYAIYLLESATKSPLPMP